MEYSIHYKDSGRGDNKDSNGKNDIDTDGWRRQLEEADASYDELFPSLSQIPNSNGNNSNNKNINNEIRQEGKGSSGVGVILPAIDRLLFLPKYKEDMDSTRREEEREALRFSSTR